MHKTFFLQNDNAIRNLTEAFENEVNKLTKGNWARLCCFDDTIISYECKFTEGEARCLLPINEQTNSDLFE